jgi:hypothetical protein
VFRRKQRQHKGKTAKEADKEPEQVSNLLKINKNRDQAAQEAGLRLAWSGWEIGGFTRSMMIARKWWKPRIGLVQLSRPAPTPPWSAVPLTVPDVGNF